ncbi:hypothetical protein T459_01494 [Capsicum annuum]|uniref:Pectinesterase inhibitor domain-containing protein n=1 Tax=Capsicum annuum TaxID=4072 RepID=A0A2G3AHA1_CAPAN|nr:uncharacterized protein LOC107847443 [Capsicum annuum]PHT93612.1 hypothetical protein T459_01494 [Capsicum annuum]
MVDLHMNKFSRILLIISLISISISSQITIANGLKIPPRPSPINNKNKIKNLVTSLMVSLMAKTEEFVKRIVLTRLAIELDEYKKDYLETCKEVYEDAVDAMKSTLKDVNEGNYYKANVDVSAVSENMETCKECVKEIYGDDPEFTKFDNWSHGIIEDALTRITRISR